MKIAFGAALPVGVGSTCEIFDVQLTRYVAPDKALSALREASVTDLMVTQCCYIDSRAAAASVAFPFSTYEVAFASPVKHIGVPETVSVVRKRKEKVLCVSDFVARPFTLAPDGMSATFTLEAKNTGSLRPDVLMKNCDAGADVVSIIRVAQHEQRP